MSQTTPWTYDVMKQRSMALTALYETSTASPACFGVVGGNFDGQGMSFGAIQFNFGTGNLQPIFAHMIDNYQSVTKTAFNFSTDPSYYNTFVDIVKNKTKAEQIAWADSISNTSNKHIIIEPWKTYLNVLGVTQQCIDKQVASAEWYWNLAFSLFNEYKVLTPAPNMFSRRAYALFFDIAVQNGGISATTKAQIVSDFNAINTAGKTNEQIEQEKMVIIANRRADAITSSFQTIVRERKLAIANGTGYVYSGTLYMDTSVYEMTMEEAFPAQLEYQTAGYFQYNTAEGRTQDADTAIGCTISQSNYPVNFTTMKSANTEFVYMKVSSNKATLDTQFTLANVTSARTAGLKAGFWHSANPSNAVHSGNGKTVQGAIDEANWFCDKIVAVMGNDYGDIYPAVAWIDNSAVWTNSDEAYNWIEAFVNTVKARIGRTPILQSAYYYVDGNITAKGKLIHSAKGGIGAIMPLWLQANAPDLPVVGTYPNYNFTAFGNFTNNRWNIWQFTTSGTGSTYGVTGASVILNFMNNMNDNTIPVAPAGLAVVAGDTKCTLSWNQSPHIKVLGYKVYRDNVLVATVSGWNTLTYEDTNLVNGTQYSYKITAYTQWQESDKTSAQTATPVQPIVSLFPYFPHSKRDESITGHWSFTNPVTIGGNTALTSGDFGTTAGKVAQGNHNHSGVYEPVISPKKTGFNLDLGTTSGTVAEGNHTHTNDHTHSNKTQLDKVPSTLGTNGQVLKSDGTNMVWGTDNNIDLTASQNPTGLWTFSSGIHVQAKTNGNNSADDVKYVRLARVKFTSTFNRAMFDIKIAHTGTFPYCGVLKGFFYNAGTVNTLHASSYLWAVNDGNQAMVSGDIVYMPIDGTTVYYVDIFAKVKNFAKLYETTPFEMFENGATLTINPDNSTLLTALPAQNDTIVISSVTCTYGASVNATIKTVTMT